MLITTDAVLAMRCPDCGRIDVHNFSRFAFPKGKAISISCSCGAVKLEVVKNRSVYLFKLPCMVCETVHLHEISGKALWSGEVTRLSCRETNLVVGNIGPVSKIGEMMISHEQQLKTFFDDLGCGSYFHNARIMFEALNRLHDIVEAGELYCQCGNHKIEVDIFPDRLELHCKNCDSINIVYAETDDLNVIRQVDSIELARHGFKCLDSLANAGKLKKTRRKRNKT
jgi:Zn finger protein HypA/HybF involved in hydrogenase expression